MSFSFNERKTHDLLDLPFEEVDISVYRSSIMRKPYVHLKIEGLLIYTRFSEFRDSKFDL